MNRERTLELIRQGENVKVEFKECRKGLNKDVYETICSFLNRCGGDILLGVSDQGKMTGIEPETARTIRKDLITTLNNPGKINPAVYLVPEILEIDSKTVIWLSVPESSQIHQCHGRIFDRNDDADLDITGRGEALAAMAVRKQKQFTENTVYPYLTINELRSDLISRVRTMATLRIGQHPWSNLSDEALLRSAGMFLHDYTTGQSGFTLAAALLFGRDDVIRDILPCFRTDALLRRFNLERYDDRDDIRTNLIDSYSRLMAFIEKHLNDPFYLEGGVRISVRHHLFREIIANLLIHREYTHPVPARLIIEKDRVVVENGNKAHGYGEIALDNYVPIPKNPVIAGIFKEIGWADELGSGVRNSCHYSRIYSGADPIFIEKDVFHTIIPLAVEKEPSSVDCLLIHDSSLAPAYGQDQSNPLLGFCRVPRSGEEIMSYLGITSYRQLRHEILQPLIKQGHLRLSVPSRPNSRLQKYLTFRG